MVRSVGFNLGNFRRPALLQSMKAVESLRAQNSRSLSSDGNSGIGLLFVVAIGNPFSPVHVPNRDNTYERAAQRERNKQITFPVCLSQRIVSLLAKRMLGVSANDQWFMEGRPPRLPPERRVSASSKRSAYAITSRICLAPDSPVPAARRRNCWHRPCCRYLSSALLPDTDIRDGCVQASLR